MLTIHPQYIIDSAGQKLVVLSENEFDNIIEELEDLEDIRLYDEAKKDDDGTRILLRDYIIKRKNKNA